MTIYQLPKRFHPDFAFPDIIPKGGVTVEPDQISHGLSEFFVPDQDSFKDLVDGTYYPSSGATVTPAYNRRGRVLNTLVNHSVTLAGRTFGTSEDFTITWLAAKTTANSLAGMVCGGSGVDDSNYIWMSNTTSGVRVNRDNTFVDLTISSISNDDLVWRSVVVTSAEIRYLANNEVDSTGTTGKTFSLQEIGSGFSNGVLDFAGEMQGFIVHNRALSDAEAFRLHDDVYRINLKPSIPQTYFVSVGGATGTLTGTVTASIDESDIVTGGKTVILTLTGDTFVTGTTSEDAIAGGSDSDKTGANKWDALIKTDLDNADVVISTTTVTNDTATITLPAYGTYDADETETITWTIPAASLTTSTSDIVVTPTFTIDTVSGFQVAWAMNSNVIIQGGIQ